MKKSIEQLRAVLESEGLGAGLRLLNDGVGHRYTAVYRLARQELQNVALHDKQGEIRPEFLEVVPLQDSFCQFVLRDGFFKSHNTGLDRRLDGHKYQGVLLTYHGVPLLDDSGELYGTLCHFDASQQGLSDDDFNMLKQAAKVIPGYLPKGV